MQNSDLYITTKVLHDTDETEYRVSLSLHDVVHSTYTLNNHLASMFQPRDSGGGSFGIERDGLRDMVLRHLESELQAFISREISKKFAQLRNETKGY